jgi:hypothetical protein
VCVIDMVYVVLVLFSCSILLYVYVHTVVNAVSMLLVLYVMWSIVL